MVGQHSCFWDPAQSCILLIYTFQATFDIDPFYHVGLHALHHPLP